MILSRSSFKGCQKQINGSRPRDSRHPHNYCGTRSQNSVKTFVMAGLSALGGHEEGRWYVCNDGWPLELLDAIQLLFPNEGRKAAPEKNYTGAVACFEPRHFQFIQNRPKAFFLSKDLADTFVLLFLCCAIVTATFAVTKFIWCAVDPTFASIRPAHKQWYVVATMHKMVMRACMSLSVRYWAMFYYGFFEDQFASLEIKRLIVLISAIDIVGLYMVPKLPRSTRWHHVIVVILCVSINSLDLSVPGWGGLLGASKIACLYGAFGTAAFTVNAYMALRVVYPKAEWIQTLASVALVAFLVCSVANWTAHSVWLGGLLWELDISVGTFFYSLILVVLVYDDIFLIKWLIKRGSPMDDDNNKENGLINVDLEKLASG